MWILRAAVLATVERRPALLLQKNRKQTGNKNIRSGLTNPCKLRIIKQVTGFGGRPPVHRFQDKIENKK